MACGRGAFKLEIVLEVEEGQDFCSLGGCPGLCVERRPPQEGEVQRRNRFTHPNVGRKVSGSRVGVLGGVLGRVSGKGFGEGVVEGFWEVLLDVVEGLLPGLVGGFLGGLWGRLWVCLGGWRRGEKGKDGEGVAVGSGRREEGFGRVGVWA